MEPHKSEQTKPISIFERSESQRRRGRWMLFGALGMACVSMLGLFFLGGAALQWRGWDIDLDSKTGKISIKRFGEAG